MRHCPILPLLIFDSAVTVEELLSRAKRGLVKLGQVTQKLEAHTELSVQCICIVAYDGKAAALKRALGSEGSDDHLASGFDCGADQIHVPLAIARIGQKMKHGAVVPNIVVALGQSDLRDIARDP